MHFTHDKLRLAIMFQNIIEKWYIVSTKHSSLSSVCKQQVGRVPLVVAHSPKLQAADNCTAYFVCADDNQTIIGVRLGLV